MSGDDYYANHMARVTQQMEEWSGKIKVLWRVAGYAHNKVQVEIVGGVRPPDEVLINGADQWNFNFGGVVERVWEEDGHMFARVKVYTD